jgi:hypothetical protein
LEHGEDDVRGEVCLGEEVRRRKLNGWLPLRPNVGGVLRRVALASYKVDRRRADGIL